MDTGTLVGILAAFVIYFGVMIYAGIYYMKKNQTSSDYILGGRKLGKFVSAMSAEASDMSGCFAASGNIEIPGTDEEEGM